MEKEQTVADKLLRMKDVIKIVPLSRPTIYRLVENGDFPAFFKVGGATFWRESDIQKFIQNKTA